ncbi:hypothetical protein PR048_004081 [Dryococelus australis]|uniref:Uncharacterized protein n=1 Tax=Dryococelus australis TaxID=614101 RepID=A0ABQ9I4G7_9NEOP|nr:hypothetical protein PR048_004081 [Dryococelus australis]
MSCPGMTGTYGSQLESPSLGALFKLNKSRCLGFSLLQHFGSRDTMESISQKVLGSALLLAVLSTVQVGECARILGVFPITSVSHQVVYRALMMELARRGHELVVITPDPINDPSLANYTEIDVSFMYDYTRRFIGFDIKLTEKFSSFSATKLLLEWGLMLSDTLLDHEPVRRLISPNNVDEHFDLVFVEWLQQPSTYGFAYRFSAPMIGISSLPPFGFCYDSVGNPTNPSYIPEMVTPYSDRMTFFERLDNFIYFLRSRQFYFNYMFPKHDVIAKRSFGPSIPNLMEMHYNASMLFVTYEPSFHSPRPDVPAIVHLTGLHLKPPKPLPQDLQQYLDSAPKGVIYFSLGSNVRSDKLDANTLQMFLEAFAELDGYHVLWKWESDKLPGQPANVKVLNWTPQQDILREL